MKRATLHLGQRQWAKEFSLNAARKRGGELVDLLGEDDRESASLPEAQAEMAWLREHLELLTARQRQVLLLFYEHGYQETSSTLGISIGCVYSYVRTSLRKLRRAAQGLPVRKGKERSNGA